MMPWVLAAIVAVAIVVVVFLAKRGPHQEPGVVNFRKHIDALSPEARREVMDRVRPTRDDSSNTDHGTGG
ncbi:MAG: hypothetical protein Q7V88_14230 [Actinomycetota bacterium]|nr:hypothetical protein [Actinomycetota bacterium]